MTKKSRLRRIRRRSRGSYVGYLNGQRQLKRGWKRMMSLYWNSKADWT